MPERTPKSRGLMVRLPLYPLIHIGELVKTFALEFETQVI